MPQSNDTYIQLLEILSPQRNENSDALLNQIRGRFGYQICSDVISSSQNFSQRLLLINEMRRLPEIFHNLIQDKEMQRVIERELGDDNNNYKIWMLKDIEAKIDASCRTLINIADKSWRAAVNNQSCADISLTFAIEPEDSIWWRILLIVLPHLEHKVWLTDISNPIPIHTITRFYDIWLAYLFLWTYRNDIPQNEEGQLIPLFGTEKCIHGAWYTGWDLEYVEKNKPDYNAERVCILFGPFFTENESSNKHIYPLFFRNYMQLASEMVPGWKNHNVATPSQEELEELLDARLPFPKFECKTKKDTIQNCWKKLLEFRFPYHILLKREDWEYLAAAAAWMARSEYCLLQAEVKNIRGLSISFRGWNHSLAVTCETNNFIILFKDKESNVAGCESIIAKLKESKANQAIDYPSVLFNRIRERQMHNWSIQIMGINNLMHRHTQGLSLANHEHSSRIDSVEDLFHGSGARICKHLIGITQAHNVNIYRLDYEYFPPKLIRVEGYSRLIAHWAKQDEIYEEFNKVAYDTKDPASACYQRAKGRSQIYRVAANNAAELSDSDDKNSQVLWVGYPNEWQPKSALALPIRQNGKVIGVIELNGMVEGQFSEYLKAPLLRASNLIGSFLYFNLLLRQLSRINQWVTKVDPLVIEDADQPLAELAKLLTNVFLCPLTHIWLVTDDNEIYDLKGQSVEDMWQNFRKKNNTASNRPYFDVGDEHPSVMAAPFARLALELWKNAAQENKPPPWGQFCSALYGQDVSSSENPLVDDPKLLEKALTTGLYLDNNFIEAGPVSLKSIREFIFKELKLKSIAAFPILQPVNEEEPDNSSVEILKFQKRSRKPPTHINYKFTGIVVLQDYGDSKAQLNGEIIGDYSASWQPTVEYLQYHLITLLEQLSLITHSTQQARKILMHQVRHELVGVEDRLKKWDSQLHYILEGEGREALRIALQTREKSSDKNTVLLSRRAWEGLVSLQNAVLQSDKSRNYLQLSDVAMRLGRLIGLLQSVRSYKHLQIDPGEKAQSIPLKSWLDDELKNYQGKNIQKGRYVSISGFRHEVRYEVEVIKSAWERLLKNLFSNMDKYSPYDDVWEINLANKVLTLKNHGDYSPEETPEMLMKFGVRGKRARLHQGEGLGLKDAQLAAEMLGIGFSYNILSPEKGAKNVTWHIYTLDLSHVLYTTRY